MPDASLLVLAVSLLLQLGAAAMAFRLVRLTGWKATWVLLGTAIALMAVRRAITLARVIAGDVSLPPDPQAEFVALAISVLMVLGVAWLGPVIESIRRAEQEVRQLVESAPEAMIVADSMDRIVYVNAQAGRLFGYFPHQLRGRDIEMLMPERFRGAHRAKRSQFHLNARRRVFPDEAGLCGLHADGHEFPVQISVSPLETAGGLLVVGSIHDMTEQREAQSALRDSEARYRSLLDDVLDSSSVAVCILDSDLRVVWVNRAYESYLGQERKQVVGMEAAKLVRERVAPAIENADEFAERLLATYAENTFTEHFECHVLPAEGRWERWLEFWSQPIESGLYRGGRIEQYAEVTDRRYAEQRIRQFVHIVRNMQVGLFVYHLEDEDDDRTLRVRILNPAGEKLLGLTEADIAGKYIDEAFPRLRDDDVPALFAGVLRTGETKDVTNYEYGDDRVARGGWAFRAFPLPEQCVGVLFERLGEGG